MDDDASIAGRGGSGGNGARDNLELRRGKKTRLLFISKHGRVDRETSQKRECFLRVERWAVKSGNYTLHFDGRHLRQKLILFLCLRRGWTGSARVENGGGEESETKKLSATGRAIGSLTCTFVYGETPIL